MRRVDHGEALIEPAKTLACRLRLTFEPRAEPRPDRIEPVRDDACEVSLARSEPFGHAGDPAVELGAGFGEFGEALLDRLLTLFRRLPLAPSSGACAPKPDQRQERKRGQQGQGRAERLGQEDRNAVDDGDRGGGTHECSGSAKNIGTN